MLTDAPPRRANRADFLVSGVQGMFVTRIANGKVVEETVIYDALGMLRQLGVVPAAVAKAA